MCHTVLNFLPAYLGLLIRMTAIDPEQKFDVKTMSSTLSIDKDKVLNGLGFHGVIVFPLIQPLMVFPLEALKFRGSALDGVPGKRCDVALN